MNASHVVVCGYCAGLNKVEAVKIASGAKCGKCKQALFKGVVYDLEQGNFERFVTKNSLPIVVDFWASWCGPCKVMAPIFKQVAEQYQLKAFFFKVNTEQQALLSQRFMIKSIPTLILFKNGKEFSRQAGALDAHSLSTWIKQSL